jgi:hypothetical protein
VPLHLRCCRGRRAGTAHSFQGTLHAGEATARLYAALTDAQREDVALFVGSPR